MPDEERAPLLLGFDDLAGIPPTFFVGLGGSGGRVVDVLSRRLRREPRWERYRRLLHFVCVDTDRNDLERLGATVEPSRIGVANKQRRIQLLRGELDAPEDERVTSWAHSWYPFREGRGDIGAGQVRLESRFSLHCQIADGRPGNVRGILSARIRDALNALNPNVRQDAPIRFFLYGSLAGGTGSGANLPMAYLVRRLAQEAGAACEVYGMFFLPSVFRAGVQPPLHSKVNANAFAALKEIEYFSELKYNSGPKRLEFVFDPLASRSSRVGPTDVVTVAPYDWVYIADLPENMAVEQIYQAAGEAAYLQLFSPILAFQDRARTNWEQLQEEPADGYFSQLYGSMGASVLEFPRDRLCRYWARRKTVELLERLVVGKPRMAEGELDELDVTSRAFKEKAETEQNRLLDESFRRFIDHEAHIEESENRPGVFLEVRSLRSANADLFEELRARLAKERDGLESDIVIGTLNAPALTFESPGLGHARVNLSRDYKAGKKLAADRAETLRREISSGRFLSSFFKDLRVSPLQQRYFLIALNDAARNDALRSGDAEEDASIIDWCVLPTADHDSSAHLARRPPDPIEYEPDNQEVKKRITEIESRLQEAARTKRKKDFELGRTAAMREFKRLESAAYDAIVVDFWQTVMRTLQQAVEKRLNLFRIMARKGITQAQHLRAQAERCRESGTEVPDIGESADSVATFHLGNEVFHDARADLRQWHLVYRLRIEDALQVDTLRILAAVNEVLDRSTGSRAESTNADEALSDVIKAIDEETRLAVRALVDGEARMTLADGLALEARLTRLSNRETVTAAELRDVPDAAILPYMADKLRRVANMSRPLAQFDEAVLSRLHAYPPRFCGVAPELVRASPTLRDALLSAADAFDRLEDWNSVDIISFYQARLGMPLYAYWEVRTTLRDSYGYEVAESGRKQPLHIDGRWEEPGFQGAPGPGLPGLTLSDRRDWERRSEAARRAQAEARQRSEAEAARQLARCVAAGLATQDADGRYALSYRGHVTPLGTGLAESLSAFSGLPQAQREGVTEAAAHALDGDTARLAATVASLKGLRYDASVAGAASEVAAIEQLLAALQL